MGDALSCGANGWALPPGGAAGERSPMRKVSGQDMGSGKSLTSADGGWFHVEERRAWLRTQTHTVVLDREPDFARFAQSREGAVRLTLRIWLAESRWGRPWLKAYLGSVTFCATSPPRRHLRRLFRLASSSAKTVGQSPRALRRGLAAVLRGYVQREPGRHPGGQSRPCRPA